MDWKQEVLERLDKIAGKLDTTSAYLWKVLVRQGVAQGIADVIVAIICLVVAYVLYRLLKRIWAWGSNDDDWNSGSIASFIVSLICEVCFLIAFGVNLYNGLLELLNPEYFALHEVLRALMGVNK